MGGWRWIAAIVCLGCGPIVDCSDESFPPPGVPPSRPFPGFDGSILPLDSGPPPDVGMPDAGTCPSHVCSPETPDCPLGSACLGDPERVIFEESGMRCVRPQGPSVCAPYPIGASCGGLGRTDCGPCGRCGSSQCRRTCDPSPGGRGGCTVTERCDYASGLCFEGCLTDCECRTYEDESGAVRLDSDSRATCDPTTGRCRQPSGGSVAGDPCTRDSQCEANGECRPHWPGGGYCTKYGCADGVACESASSICWERFDAEPECARGCAFGAELGDEAAMYGPTGRGEGCREGYSCWWAGTAPARTPGSGACFPGRYNDRREPNVGAACDPLATVPDCWSPLGAGFCAGGGWCSVLDCAVPGLPADFCGPGAVCRFLAGSDQSICFPTCTATEECPEGLECLDSGGTLVCSRPP